MKIEFIGKNTIINGSPNTCIIDGYDPKGVITNVIDENGRELDLTSVDDLTHAVEFMDAVQMPVPNNTLSAILGEFFGSEFADICNEVAAETAERISTVTSILEKMLENAKSASKPKNTVASLVDEFCEDSDYGLFEECNNIFSVDTISGAVSIIKHVLTEYSNWIINK